MLETAFLLSEERERKKLLSVRENRELPVFLKLLRKKKVVL